MAWLSCGLYKYLVVPDVGHIDAGISWTTPTGVSKILHTETLKTTEWLWDEALRK